MILIVCFFKLFVSELFFTCLKNHHGFVCPGNVCQYKLVTGGGGTVAKQTGGKGAAALSPECKAYSGSFKKQTKTTWTHHSL